MFSGALRSADVLGITVVARLHVAELGHLAPEIIVCDLDDLVVDSLEMLRQIRFVLPQCIIAVYTHVFKRAWARACHLAGANCILSKDSNIVELSAGLRQGILDGCFTDPRFDVA